MDKIMKPVNKVEILTNLKTIEQAQKGEEVQQSLVINSAGAVTLTRYFWATENPRKTRRIKISETEANTIIDMVKTVIDNIKPTTYLLERGTVNLIINQNGITKHSRIYLNSKIQVGEVDVDALIKSVIRLPEAKVFRDEVR